MKIAPRALYPLLILLIVTSVFPGLPADASEPPPRPAIMTHKGGTPPLPINLEWGQGLFGVISDIHFDPFYDPSLVDRLAKSTPDKWNAIFADSTIVTPSSAGSDSNYPLLKSALDSLGRNAPYLDYLLMPGDLLAHHFREKYEASASDTSQAAYKAFVLKTTRYVTSELKARLPNKPVIVTLGNNDSFCGDYTIEPAADYLYDTAPLIASLTGSREGFNNYPELGAYIVPHPMTPNHYLVVFDNIFFSRQYNNACGQRISNPGKATLLWLRSTLYRLQHMEASATLITHIPSGVDAYRSTSACSEGSAPSLYLDSELNAAFTELTDRYREVITAMFIGHSHMDDFRVFTDAAGTDYAYQRIIPAISPIFGNNPGYQIYSYDRSSATPLNLLTLTYDRGGRGWHVAYNFKRAYGVGNLSTANLKNLAGAIAGQPAARKRFIDYYTGGADDGTITQNNWQSYHCALTHTDTASFSSCLCH